LSTISATRAVFWAIGDSFRIRPGSFARGNRWRCKRYYTQSKKNANQISKVAAQVSINATKAQTNAAKTKIGELPTTLAPVIAEGEEAAVEGEGEEVAVEGEGEEVAVEGEGEEVAVEGEGPGEGEEAVEGEIVEGFSTSTFFKNYNQAYQPYLSFFKYL